MPGTFNAYLSTALGEGSVVSLKEGDLPDRPLHIRVEYSDLNYKDALAITGKGTILRSYPLVPGIDLVGEVLDDSSGTFPKGEKVLATGHGLGESESGGYSQVQRIPIDGVLKLRTDMTPRMAMQLGTAGLTAALCVMAIQEAQPSAGAKILVTGATGGVGSVAVLLLKALGFCVIASTGRAEEETYLRGLGAEEIILREELEAKGKPMDKQRWFGVVETVGGTVLTGCLRHTAEGGVVACCGMAGGNEFTASVFPFILRNIRLVGIYSSFPPIDYLERAWALLAEHMNAKVLDGLTTEIGLEDLRSTAERMLVNMTKGRILVDLGNR